MRDASTCSIRAQDRSRGGSGGKTVWTALAELADREFLFLHWQEVRFAITTFQPMPSGQEY